MSHFDMYKGVFYMIWKIASITNILYLNSETRVVSFSKKHLTLVNNDRLWENKNNDNN